MNKIYIINDNFDYEINLNFCNNTFEINNNIYNFGLIDKDKIIIKWNENNNEIYYTEDSYLYFLNENLKNNFKKIFLVHSEWNDQAIINLKTNSLQRIKSLDQYGTFNLEEDRIIINWKYWGLEIYLKKDNYTYIQENYKELIKESLISKFDNVTFKSLKK
jgi:hypothetical protein